MLSLTLRLAKGAALVVTLGLVAACGLPRSGPNKAEIFEGSVLRDGDSFIVTVDDRVNAVSAVTPALGFPGAFRDAGLVGADLIRPGDVLGLTIWENVDDGLLAPGGQNATALNEVQVDESGFIFVPYAGRIRAAGNTPEAIRRIVSERLGEQTPDPQVQVRRVAGDGATVSITGEVGGPGIIPIQRPTRTLSAMIAAAGGVRGDADSTRIIVIRGNHRGEIWYNDLFEHPGMDIALRNGDEIIVRSDDRFFTALGATGSQNRVQFFDQSISAIEAIAQVGGLRPTSADPTGVFVFRNEPEAIAEQLVGQDLTGTQRVVYVLDLTKPNGIFFARDFAIRDGDTVYVTEAPFNQFNKVIAAATGTLNSARGLSEAAALN